MKSIIFGLIIFLSSNVFPETNENLIQKIEIRLKRVESGMAFIVVDKKGLELDKKKVEFIHMINMDLRRFYGKDIKNINIVRKLRGLPEYSYRLKIEGTTYQGLSGLRAYLKSEYQQTEILGLFDKAIESLMKNRKDGSVQDIYDWLCLNLRYNQPRC